MWHLKGVNHVVLIYPMRSVLWKEVACKKTKTFLARTSLPVRCASVMSVVHAREGLISLPCLRQLSQNFNGACHTPSYHMPLPTQTNPGEYHSAPPSTPGITPTATSRGLGEASAMDVDGHDHDQHVAEVATWGGGGAAEGHDDDEILRSKDEAIAVGGCFVVGVVSVVGGSGDG